MRAPRYVLGAGLAAAALLVAAPSAHAVTFNFADPGSLLPNSSVGCFNGDDVCGTTLTWTIGPLSVTASSTGTVPTDNVNAVIQDRAPDDGGLGAVFYNAGTDTYSDGSGGDEVNTGQTLVLTFSSAVTLGALTFFDDDHDPLGATDTYLLDVDGGGPTSTLFSADLSGTGGTVFSFSYGGVHSEDFYVGAVGARSSVPEPATLGLLGMGLLAMVGIRRRRS